MELANAAADVQECEGEASGGGEGGGELAVEGDKKKEEERKKARKQTSNGGIGGMSRSEGGGTASAKRCGQFEIAVGDEVSFNVVENKQVCV